MSMPVRGLLLALCLATPALAQKDTILLHDGTLIEGVRVQAYDIDKILWKKGSSEDTRKADQVAEVTLGKGRDEFSAGFSAGNTVDSYVPFLDAAKSVDDQLLKQYGYRLAAEAAFNAGQWSAAFQILEELKSEIPVTAHAPLLFQMKLEYYLSRGAAGAGDARTTAKAYENEAVVGWSKGFQLDAKLYGIRAELAAGDADAGRIQGQLDQIIRDAVGAAHVAQRARLVKADVLRSTNQTDAAAEIYQGLVEADYLEASVKSGAWLGMGHVLTKRGQAGDSESYKQSLLAFLRVYLDRDGVPAGIVAEALFFGSQAAEKWGGEDSGRMRGYMQFLLRQNYPDSTWAQRL
ncbi:MAG: hypothetical protein AAF196_03655 [Planctomycetota bacterium]